MTKYNTCMRNRRICRHRGMWWEPRIASLLRSCTRPMRHMLLQHWPISLHASCTHDLRRRTRSTPTPPA